MQPPSQEQRLLGWACWTGCSTGQRQSALCGDCLSKKLLHQRVLLQVSVVQHAD